MAMVRRSTCARPRKPVFLLCTTIPPSVINTAAPAPRINSSPELRQRAIVSPDSSAWVATASPSEGENLNMAIIKEIAGGRELEEMHYGADTSGCPIEYIADLIRKRAYQLFEA